MVWFSGGQEGGHWMGVMGSVSRCGQVESGEGWSCGQGRLAHKWLGG